MALIKTSGLISDIVGKISGTVFQRTQGGLIARNQSGKINSNTERSNTHKVGMITAQNAWMGLTNAERTLWQTYALFLKTPQKKNPTLIINGHQLFLKLNSLRYDLHFDNTLFTPTIQDTPVLTNLPQPINVTAITRVGVLINATLDRPVNSLNEVVSLYASRPLTASQMTSNRPLTLMRTPTQTGTTLDFNANYVKVYGRRVEVGEYIQIRVAVWDDTSKYFSSFSNIRLQVA